jgi:hypothetical protein
VHRRPGLNVQACQEPLACLPAEDREQAAGTSFRSVMRSSMPMARSQRTAAMTGPNSARTVPPAGPDSAYAGMVWAPVTSYTRTASRRAGDLLRVLQVVARHQGY